MQLGQFCVSTLWYSDHNRGHRMKLTASVGCREIRMARTLVTHNKWVNLPKLSWDILLEQMLGFKIPSQSIDTLFLLVCVSQCLSHSSQFVSKENWIRNLQLSILCGKEFSDNLHLHAAISGVRSKIHQLEFRLITTSVQHLKTGQFTFTLLHKN